MTAGKEREVLKQSLEDLLDYTVTHFRTEEELMRRCGYPTLAAHTTTHDALARKAQDFAVQFGAGRVNVSLDLTRFLRDWFYQHILKSDEQYVPYVTGWLSARPQAQDNGRGSP
jgi:hemerythrin-like metal-binding protein